MAERIKVFFASSSELKDEREKCIYIANKLRKAHEHLDIDAVLWENDMTHSSFPGNSNIQDAITNSELKDSPVVVFLFHSKIGQYTREEFDYATKSKKNVFIYFKAGFSPEEEQLQAYTELLQFKKSLNSTVLYDTFKDLTDFENKLFSNLNLFFSQQYRASANATALPSADIKNLMMQMMQEMKMQKNSDSDNSNNQLAELQAELKKMREQLFAKDEKAKAQHEKTKHELEQQLSGDKKGNESLIRALEEIEIGNYDVAEEYLLKRVKELKNAVRSEGASNEIANDLAGTYYQLGRTQELQFDYQEAFNYYKKAYETLPEVAEYKYEMARMAVELSMWDEALKLYNEALPGVIEVLGENSWEVADIYIGMATCFSSLGNEEDNVIEYTEGALEIMRLTGNEEDPALIVGYDNLAYAYKLKEDYTKAVKYGKKAIALSVKLDGEDNSVIPYYYRTLGDIYDSKGEYEKAIDLHSKAIDIYLQTIEEDDPNIKLFYISLGSACRGFGAYDEALDSYKLSLAIAKKHPAEDGWAVDDIQQMIKEITKEKKDAG